MKTPNATRASTLLAAVVLILTTAGVAQAQSPYDVRHHLANGRMAPGLAADAYRRAHPELNYHVQPVRITVPEGALVHAGIAGGFIESYSNNMMIGLAVGPVYRFQISQIPRLPGKRLYPSVELLGKLNPPQGMENKFPVEIHITQDDLREAYEGRMVTKVIYLENPKITLPHRHAENHQPTFDVGGRQDPLRTAERLGRPMAILRIGSRIPTHTEDDLNFGFNGASPVILAETIGEEAIPGAAIDGTVNPHYYNGESNMDWNDVEQIESSEVPERLNIFHTPPAPMLP